MTEPNDIAALDDIAFLARSASRVRVLETLAADPHDRAELQAATGIPRAGRADRHRIRDQRLS